LKEPNKDLGEEPQYFLEIRRHVEKQLVKTLISVAAKTQHCLREEDLLSEPARKQTPQLEDAEVNPYLKSDWKKNYL
jgi:hypothetical protein